jgi:hypothetical protein
MKQNKVLLKYLGEPTLSFSNNQKAIDPRDGLMLFAPFSYPKIIGVKTIGIVGPEHLRNKLVAYLKRMHSPILNSQRVMARPNFPGFEAVFGVSVNFNNIIHLNVESEDINTNLKFSDAYQRIHKLVSLYYDPLKRYSENQEVPVDLWFVVIHRRYLSIWET